MPKPKTELRLKVDSLQPGEVLYLVVPPSGQKRRDGQSILNGLAQLAFGRGNYTVRSEADRICLMRRQT